MLKENSHSYITVSFCFSPSDVAKCLLELVTDETKNGEALIVKYNLKKYKIFPSLSWVALGNDKHNAIIQN